MIMEPLPLIEVAEPSQPAVGGTPRFDAPVSLLHRHALDPLELTPLPMTHVPSLETPLASPRGDPESEIKVCTPSTHTAPCRNPLVESCQPTITSPPALQSLARVLLPATVVPRLTTPVDARHRIACALPAVTQPNPTRVVPSSDTPQPELDSPPEEDPRPPKEFQMPLGIE